MKVRMGFVSNSSSSSFLIPVDSLSESELEKIKKMKSYDVTNGCRKTGYISPENLELFAGEYAGDILEIIQEYKLNGNNTLILIRESDEGMGGYFSDYGIDDNITDKNICEFEYH